MLTGLHKTSFIFRPSKINERIMNVRSDELIVCIGCTKIGEGIFRELLDTSYFLTSIGPCFTPFGEIADFKIEYVDDLGSALEDLPIKSSMISKITSMLKPILARNSKKKHIVEYYRAIGPGVYIGISVNTSNNTERGVNINEYKLMAKCESSN